MTIDVPGLKFKWPVCTDCQSSAWMDDDKGHYCSVCKSRYSTQYEAGLKRFRELRKMLKGLNIERESLLDEYSALANNYNYE